MTDKILAEKQIVLRPYLEIFGLSYLHATAFPSDFRALRLYPLLELGEKCSVFAHSARKHFLLLCIGQEHSDRFADTPFNRMQTVTTVRDMGRPDIFAGRQYVIDPLRNQSAQWYLERQRIHIDVIISAERRMEIDAIVALPWCVLALISAAVYARMVRGEMLENLGEDYVRTARAVGLPERRVIGRHVMRNISLPVVTFFALDLGGLLGGAVITERVFSMQGMGALLMDAVGAVDVPIVMGVTIVSAAFVIIANLAVDAVAALIDPRV